MASSKDTAVDRLLHLACVHVKQKTTRLAPNKYTVTASDGEVLFSMKEEGGVFTALQKGHSRAFHIDAVDNQERPVFSLRRPYSFASDKVEVSMNGVLVSVVRKETTFMKPVYHVNDARDGPMLRIKGNTYANEFQLQTTNKKPIGSICKNFRGVMKEMFSYADDYVIDFPADLDVRFKIAVIGACILIDYRFHES